MSQKRALAEFDALLIVILAGIAILSAPHIMRSLSQDSLLIGREPYYHERMANEIKDGRIQKYDEMVYGHRPYLFNLYHVLLAGGAYVFGAELAPKAIPFLFGILSLLLFYSLLRELKLDLAHRFTITLILVSCPAFIYTFTLSNPMAALIFLDLLGFYLILKDNKALFILATAVFISTMFFGFLNALLTLTVLIFFILFKPKKLNYHRIIFIAVVSAAFFALYYLSIYVQYGLPQRADFIQRSFIKSLVSDLGSNGFRPFTMLLAGVGLIITWRKKYKFAIMYFFILCLVVLLFYFNVAIYLSFVLSVLAGSAFMALIKMKWELRLIKNLTILILVLGLLFSTIAYLGRLAELPPDKGIINSLKWLSQNSGKEDVVFSHYSNGFWIEDIAQRQAVMDGMFSYLNADQRNSDSDKLFYSRNLRDAKSLIESYDIKYIWIDREMKQRGVWTREDQGLLFLFRNNETFNKVYDQDDIEIWAYIGKR